MKSAARSQMLPGLLTLTGSPLTDPPSVSPISLLEYFLVDCDTAVLTCTKRQEWNTKTARAEPAKGHALCIKLNLDFARHDEQFAGTERVRKESREAGWHSTCYKYLPSYRFGQCSASFVIVIYKAFLV
jgi:hypothetical protein